MEKREGRKGEKQKKAGESEQGLLWWIGSEWEPSAAETSENKPDRGVYLHSASQLNQIGHFNEADISTV